jgi:hypothetical protein
MQEQKDIKNETGIIYLNSIRVQVTRCRVQGTRYKLADKTLQFLSFI